MSEEESLTLREFVTQLVTTVPEWNEFVASDDTNDDRKRICAAVYKEMLADEEQGSWWIIGDQLFRLADRELRIKVEIERVAKAARQDVLTVRAESAAVRMREYIVGLPEWPLFSCTTGDEKELERFCAKVKLRIARDGRTFFEDKRDRDNNALTSLIDLAASELWYEAWVDDVV